MFDVYIDDIRFKTFGCEGSMNKLAIESGENKALLIFNDDALYQLYTAFKNRLETKRMIPVYNRAVEANTADVKEVWHGEWIEREHWIPLPRDYEVSYDSDYDNCYDEKTHSWKEKYWHCSCCSYEASRDTKPAHKYCPHCGAKMDKEVETREETGINAHAKGLGSE